MSEVEKMYKNAGVEKQYYSFDSADRNTYTWELNENGNDKHNMYFIGKPKIKNREFTAEKQLSLIKWLLNNKNTGILKFEVINGKYEVYDTYYECDKYRESLDEALADYICCLWQDLTDKDRAEIRSILNG